MAAPRSRSRLIGRPCSVYLLQQADPALTARYGLLPVAVEAGQYERLITAAFLHASLLHLASNMLALYIVGAPLERVLGSGRYAVVYLASALGGSLLALAAQPAGRRSASARPAPSSGSSARWSCCASGSARTPAASAC